MAQDILVRIPGYSKSQLFDMFDGLPFRQEGVQLSDATAADGMAMDPATIAITITSATLIVVQLLKSLTDIYLHHMSDKKASEASDTPAVTVRVELVLGGELRGTVASPEDIPRMLPDLPHSVEDINLISLEQACP